MNKKLLVLLIVPVMVTMSGALAFSAFTGSVTTNLNVTDGTMTYNQNIQVVNYMANNTVLNASMGSNLVYLMDHNGYNVTTQTATYLNAPKELGWAGEQTYSTHQEIATVSLNNFAPGNWIELNLTIVNNGSVGFVVGPVTLTLTGDQGTYIQPQAVSVSEFMGYEYNESSGINNLATFTTQSGVSHSIDVGHDYTISVYIGLGIDSLNDYQANSGIVFTVSAPITSDP